MREVPCPACKGARLKPFTLAVTVDGQHPRALQPCPSASRRLRGLDLERPRPHDRRAGPQGDQRPPGLPARRRARLPLAAPLAATLAGGEAQRIRLASQIGSGLVGVLYVLDEPSIGLHQRDNRRLIDTLQRLRDLGNTVLVVEHDEDTIGPSPTTSSTSAPGAGEHGGAIVHAGTVKQLLKNKESITGQYLSGKRSIPVPQSAAARRATSWVHQGRAGAQPAATSTSTFPLGCFVAVTGVSGRASHARQRHPAALADAEDLRSKTRPASTSGSGHRAPRQGHRHRPVAHRPHPAVQPGHLHRRVRPRPQAVRPDHRGQGARLPARPLQLQREGRSLRELRGRRHDQDRDALPARRVRAVRGVQGRPVQPRHARHQFKGKNIAEVLDMPSRRRSSSSPTSR
jgi:excinuclease ABC subunit A